jgi:serpin B
MNEGKGSFGLGSIVALLGVGLLAGGCSGGAGDDPGVQGVVAELRSYAPRVTPEASEAARATEGERAFAFDLLHAQPADSNLAFSPHSLSTAFAMLSDAASGQTLAEIEQVLHFGAVDETFHRSRDALALALGARNREAEHSEQRNVDAQILTESNEVWIRRDVPPEPSYLDTLARFYGAGVQQADFEHQPKAVRAAINAKVSQDTRGLISNLIPEAVLTRDTVTVLTNAMYFKAPWAHALQQPVPGDFHLLDGTSQSADMLRAGGELRYFAGDSFESVSLPYYGGDLELLLVVPDAGAYDDVRSALSSELLTQVVAERSFEDVDLTLPKFNVKSAVPAADTLKSLGMEMPFTKYAAEFPKLTSETYPDVYVSDVLHQATVAIDEKGTEASAATAIVVTGLVIALPDPPPKTPKVVVADRPFLFVIRDNPTGSLLFVGQVVAP